MIFFFVEVISTICVWGGETKGKDGLDHLKVCVMGEVKGFCLEY